MNARGHDWRNLLSDATERVQKSVSEIAAGKNTSLIVGTGAAGDKTLLADRRAEEDLLSVLLRVEGLQVLSEEAGRRGDAKARLIAVVDPLDGSANFEREIPFYCTSIAIADGPTVHDVFFGIVRNLVTGDVYISEKGKGAMKNGETIRTSSPLALSEAVAAMDLSTASVELLRSLSPLMSRVRRLVHYGANALELCYLAEGRIDAFVDIRKRMRITDFAAGYLIATEAGALITDEAGRELRWKLDLSEREACVASADARLHNQILELLPQSR
ncbi:MAG: inositol monophosphatase family protein [Nitrososphaerales archaeon]|jgi:myo-inositol-1(or 4)-monophosphatase